MALIFVGDDGENMIGVASGANLKLSPDDVDRLPASLFRKGDVLLVESGDPRRDRDPGPATRHRGGDGHDLEPGPAPSLSRSRTKELLSAATVITPNRVEALALAGLDAGVGAEPDWAACGARLREMGPAAVVITLGSRGCQVIGGKPRSGPRASGRGRRHGRRRRCVQWCAGGRPRRGTTAR